MHGTMINQINLEYRRGLHVVLIVYRSPNYGLFLEHLAPTLKHIVDIGGTKRTG